MVGAGHREGNARDSGALTWISRAWYRTTRPSRMTVERLMRHLSANEYRDSWAERERKRERAEGRRTRMLGGRWPS